MESGNAVNRPFLYFNIKNIFIFILSDLMTFLQTTFFRSFASTPPPPPTSSYFSVLCIYILDAKGIMDTDSCERGKSSKRLNIKYCYEIYWSHKCKGKHNSLTYQKSIIIDYLLDIAHWETQRGRFADSIVGQDKNNIANIYFVHRGPNKK